MRTQPGQIVGQVGPYAIGGERDVRVRAVVAIAAIEQVRQVIDVQLKALPRCGGFTLYYDRRDDRFEWRRWERRRRLRRVGVRLEGDALTALRPTTRARIQAAQEMLEARGSALRVLRLAEWALAQGEGWQEATVTLRWSSGALRRAMWAFMLSGGIARRGNVQPMDGVVSGQAAIVRMLNVGRERDESKGEVARGVRHVVEEMRRLDGQLSGVQGQLRGWLRSYYEQNRDAWVLRQMIGAKRSRHVNDELCERLLAQVVERERRVLEGVLEAIQRRRRLKRVLHVLAALGEAAQQWPGGQWQLRGERGEGRSAAWVAAVAGHGMSVVKDGVTTGQGTTR